MSPLVTQKSKREKVHVGFINSRLIVVANEHSLKLYEMKFFFLCYTRLFETVKRNYGQIWTFFSSIGKIILIDIKNQIVTLDLKTFLEQKKHVVFFKNFVVTSISQNKMNLYCVCTKDRRSYVFTLNSSLKLVSKIKVRVNDDLVKSYHKHGKTTLIETFGKTSCLYTINSTSGNVVKLFETTNQTIVNRIKFDVIGNIMVITNQINKEKQKSESKLMVLDHQGNIRQLFIHSCRVLLDAVFEEAVIYILCEDSFFDITIRAFDIIEVE